MYDLTVFDLTNVIAQIMVIVILTVTVVYLGIRNHRLETTRFEAREEAVKEKCFMDSWVSELLEKNNDLESQREQSKISYDNLKEELTRVQKEMEELYPIRAAYQDRPEHYLIDNGNPDVSEFDDEEEEEEELFLTPDQAPRAIC